MAPGQQPIDRRNGMHRRSKLFTLALDGGLLVGAAGASIGQGGRSKDQTPPPARSRAEETLEAWNHIGDKLIAMAKDFPEDKYDFKVQPDERTFAQNLLHVAAVDYDLISRVSGSTIGPDFGKDKHNPSRETYKTKADAVKLLESAVADGAAVIKQQGDAGLDQTMPFAWETGRHVVHVSYLWMAGIEHSSEHFGQLVVYYRANNLVPPESRRESGSLAPSAQGAKPRGQGRTSQGRNKRATDRHTRGVRTSAATGSREIRRRRARPRGCGWGLCAGPTRCRART